MKTNIEGYALPLALILVAIFSIVIASIESRSNLYNQTQEKIIDRFKTNLIVSINGASNSIPNNIRVPAPVIPSNFPEGLEQNTNSPPPTSSDSLSEGQNM